MTYEAYCSVVLAMLQVAFFGKCGDYGLGAWRWPFSFLPNLVADCRESGDCILSSRTGPVSYIKAQVKVSLDVEDSRDSVFGQGRQK